MSPQSLFASFAAVLQICTAPTIAWCMSAASSILRHYRELRRLVRRLPNACERRAAECEAREAMRAKADVGPEEAADLARVLVGTISFLRMKVPRLSRDVGRIGAGNFVVRDGKVVEGRAAPMERCAPRGSAGLISLRHATQAP
jgi:hypothetical protein